MNDETILSTPKRRRKPRPEYASVADAIEAVRKYLSPDLLKKELRDKVDHPMYGHCYVATEALWHLTGQRLSIHRGKDDEGITHWWLQDALGNRYDPTADQYTDRGKTPPYEHGVSTGFLTGDKPSKRTEILLNRVRTFNSTPK